MLKIGRPKRYKQGYCATFYMDIELVNMIRQKAWEQHKSMSELVSEILQEYFEREGQKEKAPVSQVVQG
jgi:hypothetical protein